MSNMPPFRQLDRPQPDISVTSNRDGSYLIESNISIGEYEKNAAALWLRAADEFPDRAFLVQCSPEDDWPEVTYKAARDRANQISTWLLQNGYSGQTPILILSSNSISHALLSMAALQVGIPIVPLSPSYSLMSSDFERLKYAAELVDARLVFAEDGTRFAKAIEALADFDMDIMTVTGDLHGGRRFDDMSVVADETRIEQARAQVGLETLAKILFTSGSTGMPKAVPNTHRMICAGQRMNELISEPRNPVGDRAIILDWLPWHHTYGGNVNFFSIMRVAGTLYLDDGKPAPGLFQRTIENLKRVRPTRFTSVPTAFSFLLDQMEKDESLCKSFFSRVKICQYGGAALSQELYERMQVLAVKYTGLRMPFGTGWGSTETTGMGTAVYWEEQQMGLIGVPYSGVQIKLVPVGPKFEIRVKGPHVHIGYYGRPDLTEAYFDEQGFYCMGDAVDFIDMKCPEAGLVFKGRVSEDFKLANGSWVETGSLRLSLIDALDPFARDVVIAGHDRDELSILIVPSEFVLRQARQSGGEESGPLSLVTDVEILSAIKDKLEKYHQGNSGRSRFVARAAVMSYPLSVDKGEITDKQYINQAAVLENRSRLVAQLYDNNLKPEILDFM